MTQKAKATFNYPILGELVLKTDRRGFLLYTVIFIVVIVTIFSLQFHQMARHQQQIAFRFGQSEAARQVAEAAMDEAFMWVYQQTAEPSSEAGNWLIRRVSKEFPVIPLKQINTVAKQMIRGDLTPTIKASGRIVDFRRGDGTIEYFPLDSMEGHGTLEIKVSVTFERPSVTSTEKIAACQLTRHHDFAIVSMTSPRRNSDKRSSYAQNFPLDYALLVRNGLKEFRETVGYSLNNERVRLTVNQEHIVDPLKRGKIFFGGTTPNGQVAGPNQFPTGNYVFLNLNETTQDQLVPAPGVTPQQKIGNDDVRKLSPHLYSKFEQRVQNDGGKDGKILNAEGKFAVFSAPVLRLNYPDIEKKLEVVTRDWLSSSREGAEKNASSGMYLINPAKEKTLDSSYLNSIFEGAVRKRFFYFVTYWIDLSHAIMEWKQPTLVGWETKQQSIPADEAQQLASSADGRIICTPMTDPAPTNDAIAVAYLQALPCINAAFMASANKLQVLSRFEDSFRYGGGGTPDQLIATPTETTETFMVNDFFTSKNQKRELDDTGNPPFPYEYFNLWHRRSLTAGQMKSLGIINETEGTINLRGIVHTKDPIVFEPPPTGTWIIHGQGVIIGASFVIKAPFKKADPRSLCILYARKDNIIVETSDRVEAVLIALGSSKPLSVIAKAPMQLFGALIVDRLGISKPNGEPIWAEGDHAIFYDDLLKESDPAKFAYQINISNWITFSRISEN
ncbi:MAG: hypothetical protein WA705_20935 [Candidatus Ozemobacteraceae bacterium]